jgi:carotenoid cleavage dioxygenase-like enzyme
MFERITAVFNQKITDSAKVNIAEIAEKFVALGETSMQIEFDPETLESLGVFQYEPKYKQHITTVHPHVDRSENAVYNLVTRFNRISHYRMLRLKSNGQRDVVGEIPVKEPAYLHSFGMSPRYLIIAEFPLVVNPLKLLFQIKPFIENFKWKPKQGTRFYIMDRQTGDLKSTVETDAFFAFHHLNAFEIDDELVVDINAYEDADVINAFYLNRLKEEVNEIPFGRLKRFRIDLKKHKIKQELLSDANIELARFDYDTLNMKENYTHVYGVSINEQHRQGFYNQIVKINIKDGKWLNWFEEGRFPGEPVFIPAPSRKHEDDGIVLSVVLDTTNSRSFLLVLDANSFKEIARAEVPQPILFGYHGAYFD